MADITMHGTPIAKKRKQAKAQPLVPTDKRSKRKKRDYIYDDRGTD